MSSTKHESTHRRIVETAARRLREVGYAALGVASVMRDAGLTHGGFYAHFASKDALLAEAIAEAGRDGLESLRRAVEDAPPDDRLAVLVDAYLSRLHQLHPELGCPLAALGTETARQDASVREAATGRLRELLGWIRGLRGADRTGPSAEMVLSAAVGAMVLARVSTDRALGDALRRQVRDELKGCKR